MDDKGKAQSSCQDSGGSDEQPRSSRRKIEENPDRIALRKRYEESGGMYYEIRARRFRRYEMRRI
jgi:hypothetical protein